MPNSVTLLVFRAVAVALGKVRAADLRQMVVFGEIGSDQEDGCEGEPSKQNEPDHHKLHRWNWTRLDCTKSQGRFRGAAEAFCFLILQLSVSCEPRR